ncbi:hypothetical protein [Mesorhizobium delmotii]|uniref:Uncharacterized protein n=1 Tax=Mesorhizobium delmotii TaxID=1631247 RepID=A0A2P9ADS1_9HYPH|nr:hypothetical protein [Mesorhizobium delmotii]SJM29271.1 conserved hypothetical protein [Mesorhizobium delmotii]
MARIIDAITGWEMQYFADGAGKPPAGGVVLEEVSHHSYTFAKDIRLIGIRLQVEEVSPQNTVVNTRSHFLPLSDPPFVVGRIEEKSPTQIQSVPGMQNAFQKLREFDDALFMKNYFQSNGRPVGYVVRADYTLPLKYVDATWPNSEFSEIDISQRFLFSRLANVPPHEPGGVLEAARCHPITRFEIISRAGGAKEPSKNRFRISSIRFDYRLHLRLDTAFDPPKPGAPARTGNNAGLFRDEEMATSAAAPLAPAFDWAVSQVAFAAAEKPLILEVATVGLWEGAPLVGPRFSGNKTTIKQAPHCWDNVHWWGARGLGQPMISAPGAFHAAHIHWRWGGAGSTFRSTIPEIDTPKAPPGNEGYWWQSDGARILVDPAIWIQTIRIAVTRNRPNLNPLTPGVKLESLSTEDWNTLFTGLGTPVDIEAGDQIVLWYSAEVHRQTVFPTEHDEGKLERRSKTFLAGDAGSVFLHGIFFAHGAERSGFATGTRSAEHRPRSAATIRSERKWMRPA